MAYLLDSDVFIQAKNLHYGFDFYPAFWDWIDRAHSTGAIFSIDRVRTEIVGGGDDLATWALTKSDAFFLQPDASMGSSLRATSLWASSGEFEQGAVATFLAAADYYLVAHALAHNHTVVTHEVFAPTSKKIKIPNACIGMDIPCITPFAMLRVEQARFVLR
jgi:hypothetical protein